MSREVNMEVKPVVYEDSCIRLVNSIDEWITILNEFKSIKGRCDTNCYVSIQTMEEYIAEKRLFYNIVDSTLWCYIQENNCYQGYYYVSKEQEICVGSIKFPLFTCLVGTENKYAINRENELLNGGAKI